VQSEPKTTGPEIALVLIHGIGDISPGNVLQSATRSIHRRLGIDATKITGRLNSNLPDKGSSKVQLAKAGISFHDRFIEIIEFNWTGAIGKIRLRHPFDAIRKMLEVASEFPRLGAGGGSPRHQKLANAAGMLQRWLLIALFVSMLGSMVEMVVSPTLSNHVWELTSSSLQGSNQTLTSESVVPGEIELGKVKEEEPFIASLNASMQTIYSYYGFPLLWDHKFIFTLSCALLYYITGFYWVLNFLGYLYFQPIRLVFRKRLSQLGRLWRTIFASAIMNFFFSASLLVLLSYFLIGVTIFHHLGEEWVPAATHPGLYWNMAIAALISWLMFKSAVIISNLLRDVIHYLAPDASGQLQIHQQWIRTELASVIHSLAGQGCKHIILVTHSLGTVIITDLLKTLDSESDLKTSNVFSLYLVTAGSPLRRLIHRLVPGRPTPEEIRQQIDRHKSFTLIHWFNVYRILDYVGQALTYSALPKDLIFWPRRNTRSSNGIEECLLKPRFLWPLGHSNYWSDKRFLTFVTDQVVRPLLINKET